MQFMYNDKSYEIVIIKKMGQKNTYIRVKKDLKVTVTTNYFTSKFSINNLIKDNYNEFITIDNPNEDAPAIAEDIREGIVDDENC